MPTGQNPDPYRGFRFRVEIDGIAVAHFSDVSGLQAETETEPYEEGGLNDFVHQLPKRTKFQHITLKRGITDVDELWRFPGLADDASHPMPRYQRKTPAGPFAEFTRMIVEVEKPVIAAVNGPAMGAGLSYALACDRRFG